MIVIGISGWAGSGKNTVGSFAALHLTTKYGLKVQMASLAAPLKEMARDLGWDGQKNDLGRFFLQKIGGTYRAMNPNYWINLLWEDIEVADRKPERLPRLIDEFGTEHTAIGHFPHTELQKDVFIITDVRYKNEAEWVTKTLRKEGHQTTLWRVSMEGYAGLSGDRGKHASECELDAWDFNGHISAAKGDFNHLYEQTCSLVDTLMEA